MLIEVLMEDIKAGKPDMGRSCPIAHAVRRAFPGCSVYADGGGIAIGRKGHKKLFAVSRETYRFMQRFDRGAKVQPFRFKLGAYQST